MDTGISPGGITDIGTESASPGGSRKEAPASSDIETCFSEILNSDRFRKAVVLRNLLGYLWRHRDQPVSEYAVGTEALQRKPDFDPKTDATVRVNVARLRAKLREFYEAEGRTCPLCITIPLNSHQLEYRWGSDGGAASAASVPDTPAAAPAPRHRVVPYLWAAIVVLLACCVVLGLRLRQGVPATPSPAATAPAAPFWRGFLAGGNPVTMVVPTPLFQVWNRAGAIVRDPALGEFSAWRESALLTRLAIQWGTPDSVQGFTGTQDLFAALELQKYLLRIGISPTIVGTKELEADSLYRRNVILLGLPKTSFQLTVVRSLENFTVDPSNPAVIVNGNPHAGEPARFVETTQPDGAWRRSYGVLAVVPGRGEQARRLLLVGQDTRSLAVMVTSEPRLAELAQALRQHGSPQFFDSVIEMTFGSQKLMRLRVVALRPVRPPASALP